MTGFAFAAAHAVFAADQSFRENRQS